MTDQAINTHPGVCEVCGSHTDVMTRASRIGPFSAEYCVRCREQWFEPYWALIPAVAAAGGLDNLPEARKAHVVENLRIVGVKKAAFTEDVKAMAADLGY